MRAGEGRSIAGTVNFIPEIISAIVQGGVSDQTYLALLMNLLRTQFSDC